MTPAPLDADAVQRRLRLMSDLLDDLERVGPVTRQRFAEERLVRYAVERILMQLVDLAVRVNAQLAVARSAPAPRTYRESFGSLAETEVITAELAVRLAPSVGLRNVLAHEYLAVDEEAVLAAVPLALDGYREYVRQVARALAESRP